MTSGAPRQAVIVDAVRSPLGRRGGVLAGVHPVDLAAGVVEALLARAGCDPGRVDDVILGCASPVGEQALNVARHAALAAGLPESVPGVTVDCQCGSGQQAVQFAVQGVLAGAYDVVVAGGVESMSRVPFGSALLLGTDPFGSRLTARSPDPVPQGVAADRLAARAGLTRAALDAYALASHGRAAAARAQGAFTREVVAVEGVAMDERGAAVTASSLAALEPAFEPDGVVTAGNSAPISDGAAAVLVMSADTAARLGCPVLARCVGSLTVGSDPRFLGAAMAVVTRELLGRHGLDVAAVELFEVGEQFAPGAVLWGRELRVDAARVNVHGGAIALGHPLGATGARMLVTLAHALSAWATARGTGRGDGRGGGRALQVLEGADGVAAALLLEAP